MAASYTGGIYTQNFDNLLTPSVPVDNTATIAATFLPAGWTFLETGTNANTLLRVHSGSVTTGDTILFGATGSNERALGSLASGSLTSMFGLEIVNNTGNTLTQFTLSYTGEQWRDGRSLTAVQNISAFSYGLGNTAINTDTFTPVTNLNLAGPSGVQTGTDVVLNGNLFANLTGPNFTVTGISWLAGQSLWLRWSDSNDTGNDDGLAIDNVNFSASATTINLSVSATTGTEAGTTQITVTATASSAVGSDQTVNLAVTGTNITANDYTLSNTIITIPSGQTTGSVTFTVVDDAVIESTETATLTIASPSAGIVLGTTTTQNIVITDNDAGGTLSYSTSTLNEARAFDGSIGDKIVITLTGGDSFVGNNGVDLIATGKASISNFPLIGLTPVLTLTSSTTAEFSLTGIATSHTNTNDVSNMSLTFNNSAFLGGDATKVINYSKTDLSINFADVGVSTQIFTPNAGTTVGSSDASTAIAFDANSMVVGDDEASVLRVYAREGGAAIKEWNFSADLGTGTGEVDIEASTRIGDTLYFIGSHSNKKDGSVQASRSNLFAVTVAGTGADTQFTYQGKNNALKDALVTWDSTDVHGKGANYFGFTASTAATHVPENVDGFSIEGMTVSQDGSQLLLGFRAPQTDTTLRQNALIVPVNVTNLISTAGTNTPAFGTPIELDLGGRGIRSIEKAATGGDYLILAGAAGSASTEMTNDFRLYRWNGVNSSPTELNVDLDSLLTSTGGSFESIVDVLSTAQGTLVQLLQDNGDTVWSGQTSASKDLPASQQQFQGTWVTLGANVTDTTAPILKISAPADDAVNVAINANLVLKFDEAVKAGVGNFVIKDANDNIVETINVNDASKVSIAYNTVTINPSSDLANSATYYLEAGDTVLTDHSYNTWAGLTGSTAYNFTTAAPPQIFDIRVTEVAPWSSSSSNSPVAADWFELTNTGTTAIDITGWKMDDNSNSFANAVALTGITSIAAGESVIFIENGTTNLYNTFKSNWFGTNPPSNLQIGDYTGAGVGLGTSGDAVNIYDADGNLQTNVTFGASPSASPFATFDNSDLANNATISTLSAVGTNGAFSVTHTSTTETGSPATIAPVKIHDIQGSGATAALTGTQTIEGIVTRVFQGSTKLNGFYVQEENADADTNSVTSEAIFVYDPNNKFTGVVGDKVQITGNVKEFTSTAAGNASSLTELDISAGTVTNKGASTLPSVTNVQLPVVNVADLEHYESMLVNVSAATGNLVVTENYQLGRYGQVVLASTGVSDEAGTDARLDQYTQFHSPSVSGYATYQAELDTRKIYLDDGSSSQNLDPTLFGRGGNPLSATNTLRGGDTVANVTGILDERFEGYRIQTSSGVNFTADNPRPETPPVVGGALKIASFNVLNYFNDLDTGSNITTNGLTFQPRGANNATEFTRQSDKVVQAITKSGADVLGLMELENNGFGANSAIQDLVNKLNASAGAGTYSFITPTVRLGTDAINVGLVYKSGAVIPVGAAAAMPDGYGSGAFDVVGRKPLAQTFQEVATGEQFTVVVNHFKSKGSSAGGVGDADANDGQGLSNGTRTNQAQDLATWLATNPTGTTDSDYLLLGDFNAYAKEDPIIALNTAGYGNLLPATSYSYVFDGQIGSLDHALGSSTLSNQVTGAEKWLINADEPTVLDYNTEFKTTGQVSSLYAVNQFRASDHNPVLVGLDLNGKPVFDSGNTGSVAENSATNTVVYTATAHDVDSNNALTYSLKAGVGDIALLNINAGALTLKSSANFEAKTSYTFTVVATDNIGLKTEKAVTVSVTNANDSATGDVTISDTAPYKDEVLTVTNNLVDQDVTNLTVTYAWFVGANTTPVSTTNTYTVTASDVTKTIKVTATYTDSFGTETVDSVATSAVTTIATDRVFAGDTSTHNVPQNDVITGASGNDTIFGYSLNDSLSGASGKDKLYGGYGNDNLDGGTDDDLLNGDNGYDNIIGGDGDDMLDGGGDSDTLDGGNGNDTYKLGYYDMDLIKDSGNNLDVDTVEIPFQVTKYILSSSIENATIIDSSFKSNSAFGLSTAISDTLTGNAKNNVLTGNNGNNLLNGDLGNDQLMGNGGNDNLNGGVGNDNLDGGTGNDMINGGAGNDILYGGVGSDTFVFTDYLSNTIDSINDFSVIDDTIQLENAIFTKLTTTGTLNGANFKVGVSASDNNDYVIYNKTSGVLLYDADGNGAGIAVQVVVLASNLALTNNDFIVS